MFEQYLESLNIDLKKTTMLWPQANGEIERLNKSLFERIRIAHAEGKEWKKDIRKYLVAHRSTPNTTTGGRPAELPFGRRLRTNLPDLEEEPEYSERDAWQRIRNEGKRQVVRR